MDQPICKIETTQAPQAVGPYSQAISVDMTNSSLLFVSGQIPIDPVTNQLVNEGIKAATQQALDNIQAILLAAGSGFDEVVRVEIFLKDLNDFHAVNEVYKKYFPNLSYPARQTVEVSKLPLDAAIEISCIAAVCRKN